jgi:hypothetical protein
MPMTSPDRDRTDRHPTRGPEPVWSAPHAPSNAWRCAPDRAGRRGRPPNARIAASLGVCQDTARKWRHRWCAAPGCPRWGCETLRSPPVFTPVQVAQVKAIACTPPKDAGRRCPAGPARNWPGKPSRRRDLPIDLLVHGAPLAVRGRPQTVAIPVVDLHHRPRLPTQGAAGAGPVRQRMWDGKPLGPNDYVISADEKTSIQARCRCHPTLPPGKSRTMRVNHDYHRRGAVAYLAAYDVHRARSTAAARTPPASFRSPPWSNRS